MIKVEKSKSPPSGYKEFLLKNPHTLLYSTPEFIEFLNHILIGENNYIIAKKGEDVLGVLIYFKAYHPKYGTIINSLPWYGSYGGCTLRNKEDMDVRKVLLSAYANEIKKEKPISATLIISPFEMNYYEEYIKIIKPQYTDQRIGQVTILPEHNRDLEDRLMMSFKQKTRNLVRKSLKQGFSFVISDDEWAWKFLYYTHLENMIAIGGKAKPKEHFKTLHKIIPQDQREIFVAIKDGVSVAALLLCYFNKTVEYITPVIKHEFRSQQPLSFLIWHAMRKAVKEGYRWWNWGGTWVSQKTLHHFKAGWGAIDIPYNYLINISSISEIKSHIELFIKIFPYYYIFPFNILEKGGNSEKGSSRDLQ